MAIFSNIIKKHHESIQEEQHSIDEAEKLKDKEKSLFSSEFLGVVKTVALPVFLQFKNELEQNGFKTEIKEEFDGHNNPYISIKFSANKSDNASESEYSVFVLKGNILNLKVEHNSYYDQRPTTDPKNGICKKEFGLQSIRKETLERNLSDFLSKSLKCHESTE